MIINADDLGYTEGVNRAVDRCATMGILRSATLMANGNAFDDAVSMVKQNRRLSIGVHLTLTELAPLSRSEEIPGLTDECGFLPPGPSALLRAILTGKAGREAIFRELDRQISKVLDSGILPTHLDSHKHVHVLPQVFDVVAELARKYSIRRVRAPFDRTPPRVVALLPAGRRRSVFYRQYLKAGCMEAFRPFFSALAHHSGLRSADRFHGVALTGVWTEAAMMDLIRRTPPGTTEWMVHPGDCDEELRNRPTRLLEERERERDLLVSPLVADFINSSRERIVLGSYAEEFD